MRIAINYRKGNPKLKEGIESAGHEVIENIWDINSIVPEKIDAVIFEFKYIFKERWQFFSLANRLKRYRMFIITWNVDSPWNAGISKWKVNLLLRSNILSLYATHSLQDTDLIKDTKIMYLPNAAWISRYNLRGHSLEDLRNPNIYQWDVSFIGNIDNKRYPEHERRVQFLEELGYFLKNKGITFLFADSRDMSFDKQIDIIQKSRINLSCISAADSAGAKSWGLAERCYGVPACGGFLLMEDRRHASDDFKIGEEAITYTDISNCEEKILYYLDRHDERRRIAENAYDRVMREHTYKNRAERLIGEILKLK